ncbi:50S ribosomal protein l4 [Sporothrix brasiliensis 5110]|uniref:Large ribosomal subunit protein uL29m n=1 Tax=Sporothrix brasiliensis 5110 TaxID=1398154 RepID=A0A0C2FCT4_9PEZI|nr:50S ribosomal protein l4 [Sporothrix brasiliensis 5110]KIH88943.1 50S ribosomal protein l4 [Sporothrix brasiliensis 5110]
MAALGPSAARVRGAVSGWSTTRNMISCSHPARFASQQAQPPLRTTQTKSSYTQSTIAPGAMQMQQRSSFSTSPVLEKRHKYRSRDNNRLRGVSSIRRTGPRQFLSVSDSPLPRSTLPGVGGTREAKEAMAAATRPEIDPEHGLWQFFYDGQVAQPPTKDAAFGRPWMAEELRRKSWDDLHRLWWVCVKERNRIATATESRKHFDLGFGNFEAQERDAAVRETMRRIKHVLTERFYVWEDAVELARTDPEIDLSGNGPAFRPAAYLEDEPAAAGESGNTEAAPAESRSGEQEPAPVR